jgi:hypothetical protein
MDRIEESETPPHGDPFRAQLTAYISKLAAKGGKVGGARRMKVPAELRRSIAPKAPRAMVQGAKEVRLSQT